MNIPSGFFLFFMYMNSQQPLHCLCKGSCPQPSCLYCLLPLPCVCADFTAFFLHVDGEDASVKSAQEIIQPVAEHYFKMEEPPVFFFYTKGDETSDSLRDFAQLPDDDNLLVILDIPSQMVYISEEDVLTREGVMKFVTDFANNKLEGKKLRG